jgi:hypothetical protein
LANEVVKTIRFNFSSMELEIFKIPITIFKPDMSYNSSNQSQARFELTNSATRFSFNDFDPQEATMPSRHRVGLSL